MRYQHSIAICCILLPSFLSADGTPRYQVENKLGPSLPAALAQQLNASHVLNATREKTLLVRGGKVYASDAPFNLIADMPNDRITLLDVANKHFVTIPLSEYAEQVANSAPQAPAGAQSLLSSMKMTADSRLTGRTDKIQGMRAAEHEIVLSIGIPAGPNAPASPMLKIVIQIWMTQPEEVARNPAAREFVASGFQKVGGLNAAESMQKMLGQFPGMADSLTSYMKEIADPRSITLHMHEQIFMPMLALLAQRAPAIGQTLGNFDANSPLMEMNEELTEISSAPLADLAFAIPEGYTATPLAAMMSVAHTKAAPASTRTGLAPLPLKPGEYSPGNGITAPSIVTQSLPTYTEEAKAKKIEGAVLLSVIVGIDGKARNIQVIRPLDPGLDQKAIEAVGQWVFRLGAKNGEPVNVRAQIEVNFRLRNFKLQ